MANPRQRRKSRSGTSKVKTSKATIKNKRKVIVKGPAVLTENWDKTKTVRQNYRILGLMEKLNPRQAGGIEPVEPRPFASTSALDAATLSDLDPAESDDEDDDDTAMDAEPSVVPVKSAEPTKLVKGQGRIIRDASGKVIKIVMGGEGEDGDDLVEEVQESVAREADSDDDEDDSEDEAQVVDMMNPKKPWGEAMEVWAGEGSDEEEMEDEDVAEWTKPRRVGQGIAVGANLKRQKIIAKTEIVKQLEHLATLETKLIRHTSVIEADWLVSLVEKYGEDVEKMTRDLKLNVWQKTVGEIKRAITKAGGFTTLKAKAAALSSASE